MNTKADGTAMAFHKSNLRGSQGRAMVARATRDNPSKHEESGQELAVETAQTGPMDLTPDPAAIAQTENEEKIEEQQQQQGQENEDGSVEAVADQGDGGVAAEEDGGDTGTKPTNESEAQNDNVSDNPTEGTATNEKGENPEADPVENETGGSKEAEVTPEPTPEATSAPTLEATPAPTPAPTPEATKKEVVSPDSNNGGGNPQGRGKGQNDVKTVSPTPAPVGGELHNNMVVNDVKDTPPADQAEVVAVSCDSSAVHSKAACKLALSLHQNPVLYGVLLLFACYLCYRRWRVRCCRRSDTRGEYRAVATQFGNSLFDGTFDDDYSSYGGDSTGSYDLDDDWSKGPKDGIEMSTLRNEVNGGLTLAEMNG